MSDEPPKDSLAHIWRWSAENLVQLKGDLGIAKAKRACAMGAIHYCLSDGLSVMHCNLPRMSILRNTIFARIKEFESKYGKISVLNDTGWTFEKFSQAAEAINV